MNSVHALRFDSGEWCDDDWVLKTLAINFYKYLFTKDDSVKGFSAMRGYFPPLEALVFQKLSVEVIDDEIKKVMFDMHPQKLLGIDGMHVMFYQKNWEVVGRSICSFVHDAFLDGNIADWVNRPVIVLIPKVEKQERI